AYVADEETTSKMGIRHLIDLGKFSEDDVIMVPDWGSPGGVQIEVAEKSMLWLRFVIEGKTTHGSTPERGINAYRVSTLLLTDLMESLPERFGESDPMFVGKVSTFEPTKRPATVENVNTIPGYDEFCMDMRILPRYDVNDVEALCREIADSYARDSGATIRVEEIEKHVAGKPSSTDTDAFRALADSVEMIIGNRPEGVGIGGGTCANFFRESGYDAYVWQCGGGTLHAPNEHVVVENLVTDAKVYAALLHRLCL
ncbi:MAG: M20/M25/M40 family metallo-hydrolase, partial [Thermoplasmata archaeon]|nr:M20/M25/M40 family metallo-hydrolase [Thermoplasmata archaeon]